jgi:hypothetical protein
LNFLSILRAGSSLYVIDTVALDYMRGRGLPEATLALLEASSEKEFADPTALMAHLKVLGLTDQAVTPDPVTIATEGALWGAIYHQALLKDTVVVSDGAGQFRIGDHAACWIHAERLVHKLIPVTDEQRRAVDVTRQLIWWFYADLKAYKQNPCPRRATAMRARFDRIFTRSTGYVMLDRLLTRLHKQKADLLRVLERPEIPLHTNGSENDIRAVVTKRKISGGTMERSRPPDPRRPARSDEDLPQARRIVLRVSRPPPRRRTGAPRPAPRRSRPSRCHLSARKSAPTYHRPMGRSSDQLANARPQGQRPMFSTFFGSERNPPPLMSAPFTARRSD